MRITGVGQDVRHLKIYNELTATEYTFEVSLFFVKTIVMGLRNYKLSVDEIIDYYNPPVRYNW